MIDYFDWRAVEGEAAIFQSAIKYDIGKYATTYPKFCAMWSSPAWFRY